MPEYEGGTAAPNPDVVDSDGNATLGGIGQALGNALAAALNIINEALGIPAAQASSTSVVSATGQVIGFTVLPGMQPGSSLVQGLLRAGASIDMDGTIRDSAGRPAGQINLDQPGADIGAKIGPVNVDINTDDQETNTPGFGIVETGVVPFALSSQLNGVTDQGGTVALGPIQRVWTPTICSTRGVPIVDYNNCQSLFSSAPTKAFLAPLFIGGLDGIYSLHTGQRVVPPSGPGYPAQAGWGLGPWANYAKYNVAMGWTAQGRSFFWGMSGDFFDLIDPSTGRTPVIAAAVQVKGWNGSQQISTDGYSWDYPTAPSGSDPRYNTSINNIVAYSNFAVNAAFQSYSPGSNPGGPDGGPSR